MDLSEFNPDQRRNLLAAGAEAVNGLAEDYRRRNRSPWSRAKRLSEQAEQNRIARLNYKPAKPTGKYGPGTGQGQLPSKDRWAEVNQSPSLLEQLRKDGRPE
jgi:hypothetical protein